MRYIKNSKVWIAAIILIIGGAVLVVNGRKKALPGYVTVPAVRGDLEASVSATGTVNPVKTVQVGSQVSGRIVEIRVDYNGRVKRGDLIARIDPTLFQAQVAQQEASHASSNASVSNNLAQVENARATLLAQEAALRESKADLDSARSSIRTAEATLAKAQSTFSNSQRTYRRMAELVKENLVSQSERDTAQTDMNTAKATVESASADLSGGRARREAAQARYLQAEAQVEGAKARLRSAQAQLEGARAQLRQSTASMDLAWANLNYTRILAPVDGIVISRNVDVGQTVAASFQAPVLFQIAEDLSKMEIASHIDEADIGRIKEGQEVHFTVDAFPAETFSGVVTQVRNNPVTLQNVVTYDAIIRARNPRGKLRPGMTANVSILVASRKNVLKIPNAALRFRPPDGDREKNESDKNGRKDWKNRKNRTGRRRTPADKGDVWILGRNGKIERISLTLGISDGYETEVLSGPLKEGQEVVTETKEPGTKGKKDQKRRFRMSAG
ncbi:MAG: efflux RND transporter periplasmic adaptor subunit [Armatimonadetes bacterium]|nr:efflux RND transporter periplasmic adaptor subunit [Armatimonadota bacterium]